MDKISIIIPVYNVESHIRKCLDSVINQTYNDLEILCIDDGSTDNSGRICDEYAAKDSRIRIFHQPNGGVSSAKNIGLKYMTGKYVGFVDSDDWVELDMFEILHNSIKGNEADISVSSYYKDTDFESIPMINKTQIHKGIIDTQDMLLYPLKRDYYMGFCGYMWNKLFLANIFKRYNLRFEETIKYGEDILLYTELVSAGKCTGVYIDKPLYHYIQWDNMTTKTKSISVRSDILTVYNYVGRMFDENGYSDLSYWVRGFYCYHAGVIAQIAFENHDNITLNRMQNEIRNYINDYIKTNEELPEKCEFMRSLLDLEVI